AARAEEDQAWRRIAVGRAPLGFDESQVGGRRNPEQAAEVRHDLPDLLSVNRRQTGFGAPEIQRRRYAFGVHPRRLLAHHGDTAWKGRPVELETVNGLVAGRLRRV